MRSDAGVRRPLKAPGTQEAMEQATMNDSEQAKQVNYYADVSIQDQIAELQGTLGTPREDSGASNLDVISFAELSTAQQIKQLNDRLEKLNGRLDAVEKSQTS
jgi:hypothetical protein